MKRHTHAGKIALIASALLVIFTCAPGHSQSRGEQSPPGQQSQPQKQGGSQSEALRVTSRLVQVTVTVQDKDGHPVTGLARDDFKIFDQGQPQQIAAFSAQTSRITANASVPASPNIFSNRLAQPADSQPPLTVIVMDAFEAKYQDRYWCRPICQLGPMFQQVRKFVSQVRLQDRVALYEIGEQLYLLQDFTNDANALRRGLDRGSEYAAQITFQWAVCQPLETEPHTMDALHEIAARLARVPGRKNLIVLSHGFPPIPLDDGGTIITNRNIDNSAKTLGNSDLPMTAIDTAGVYYVMGVPIGPVPGGGGGRGLISGGGSTPSGGGGHGSCPAPHLRDFDYSKDLAERSGGRAISETNDIAGAMRRVMDDYSATYLLGYYPDHNKWNGEFREIKVKVGRRDVEVHARNGYYAVADTASASQLAAQRLADELRSPLESTDIGLDVEADAVNVPGGVRQLKVKISLDPSQLQFHQQGARWIDNIAEYWVENDSAGKQVGTHSQTLNLRPTQDQYKAFLQHEFSFSETVPVAEGAEEIHFVLHDGWNGAIGSVIIPLSKLFLQNTAQTEKKN
jgi:VWFA-related protein